jgi:hypothetical protein
MKTSKTQAGSLRPTVGRIAAAVVIAAVTGSMFATPAFARRDDHRRGGEWRGHRGGGVTIGAYPYAYPYGYAQPVYAPAPVYYPPQPSPGVSLFFPLNVRIR